MHKHIGATLQNLLKLFEALVNGRLIALPTIKVESKNIDLIIY